MERRYRLRQAKDFERLRRGGRQVRHPMLSLSFAPNNLSHNRYGYITTRRLGKAVVRNRVRRRLREVVHLLHPRLRTGFDVVLIARASVIEQPFTVIQRTVSDLFKRAGLIEDGS